MVQAPDLGTSPATLEAPCLAGLRVLDFTQVLSGPFGTQILGDLGAEVIKVEPLSGDPRGTPPHYMAEDSVYVLSINRNKRSVAIDLKAPEGAALARRLVLASDVVVENFRPGVLERLGLSAEALRAEKPALIWCSISRRDRGADRSRDRRGRARQCFRARRAARDRIADGDRGGSGRIPVGLAQAT